jgi:hypothetical protein
MFRPASFPHAKFTIVTMWREFNDAGNTWSYSRQFLAIHGVF